MIKGKAFNAWRPVGLAAQAVRIHNARGVDELVLLDIDATTQNRGPDLTLVRELADACFMPLSVGGGIRSLDDAKRLLEAGADKVVVRSGGFRVAEAIASAIGCQAVVAALDVTANDNIAKPLKNRQMLDAIDRAMLWEQAGAGEIMLTRCEREGTMMGYDLDLIQAVSRYVKVPVIAHGGCGTYEHMRRAIETGADAVAAGSMFLFTDATPKGAAEYLNQHNIEARV